MGLMVVPELHLLNVARPSTIHSLGLYVSTRPLSTFLIRGIYGKGLLTSKMPRMDEEGWSTSRQIRLWMDDAGVCPGSPGLDYE